MAGRTGAGDTRALSLAAAQTDGPGMAMFPPEPSSLTFDLRRVQQLGLRAPGRVPRAPVLNRNIDIGGGAYNAWSPVRSRSTFTRSLHASCKSRLLSILPLSVSYVAVSWALHLMARLLAGFRRTCIESLLREASYPFSFHAPHYASICFLHASICFLHVSIFPTMISSLSSRFRLLRLSSMTHFPALGRCTMGKVQITASP